MVTAFRRVPMSDEERTATLARLDAFSSKISEEQEQQKRVEQWRLAHPFVVAGGAVGFLLFGCYVWIEFVKLCILAGQFTWP